MTHRPRARLATSHGSDTRRFGPGESGRRARLIAAVLSSLLLVHPACRPSGPDAGGPTGPQEPGTEPTVSISLAWDPPQTDVEGRPLDDLAGFRLYFGTRSPLVASRDTFVDVGTATSFRLEGLEPDTYFFAISAVDETGNESELSNEVGAELSPP